MRHVCTLALTAGLLAFAAAPAFAQPGGGRGGFGPPTAARLLNNKGVQDELKITDDEKTKIQAISDKYKDDLAAARKDRNRDKMRELSTKMNDDVTKAIPDILTKDQAKRLNQILVQVSGFEAYAKDDVQSALKLTDAQKKDYTGFKTELEKDAKDLMENAGQDRTKRREARTKIQEETKADLEKFTGSFTDDQKKAWKDLTGEAFEYKPDMGGNRPGGNRPGGNRPPRTPPTTPPAKAAQ